MNRKKMHLLLAAGLLIITAMIILPFQVGSAQVNWGQATWPTATFTPEGGPVDPTNTPPPPPPPTTNPGGGGGGSTPTAVPADTPVPGETSSPTALATIVIQTPEGGYEATAQPCGVPPTVQALGLVNVRSGPGLDYDPIDSLIYLEARPIVGRAEFATWWMIQLPDNVTGWVATQAVAVQGYTGGVPIVEPPDINGSTPTPGPLWEPTPNPICTPEPTPTATSTVVVEEAQPTNQPVSNSPTEAPPEPTDTPVSEPPTMTATPEPAPPTETAVPVPDSTNSPLIEETPVPDVQDPGSSTSSMILFVGIGLLAVGAASFILRRK